MEAFGKLSAGLVKLVDFNSVPLMMHVDFTSNATAAREAPVTAFKSFMLPENASTEQKTALEDAFLKLAQFNMSNTACVGYARGWTLETIAHDEAPSGKATVFNAIVGWPARQH